MAIEKNGEALIVDRAMKWRFEFEPRAGYGGKAALVEFDSTTGLLIFLLAGINVACPGDINLRYLGKNAGSVAEIVADET